MELTIGQLAKQSESGIETIRYYEREGLIKQPLRRPGSGYRKYPTSLVERLAFIGRAKGLGFSLKEIRELLSLRDLSQTSCAPVRSQAQAKIADIQKKIEDLVAIKDVLEHLVAVCDAQAPISECPILEAMSDNKSR